MNIAPGSRLGSYEVVGPLGAGGMGEVYRARDTRLDREVAIKVLPAEVSEDAGRMRRFEKEARAASALNHPNIVTVHEIGREGSTDYLVMELVQGRTLRDLLLAGPLPVKKLLTIAAQVADGLSRAHEAGIVHRDLKPENVMVTKDGLVKILDFGLAKRTGTGSGSDEASHLPTETGTSPGMIVGTVGYMSPEQAAGQAVDFRSDQFAFGSILYEMITGKRAFLKKTGIDTLSAILNEDPPPVAELVPDSPAPLRWIVETCLAKDPSDRYGSTRDLGREIARIRDHLPEASATSADFAVRKRRRIGAALALSSLAGSVVVLAAGIALGRRTGITPPPEFRRLTFQRGNVATARFTADGQTIVYSASWNGEPFRVFSMRREEPESTRLPLPDGMLNGVSRSGELAMVLGGGGPGGGTLARSPLSGGAPREILEHVRGADWAPDSSNLLVVRDAGGKRRLEYPIGRLLYETTGFIRYARVSPRGDLAAFLDSPIPGDDSSSVAVVDREGRKRTLATGFTAAGGLAWSRDGREVWFSGNRASLAGNVLAVSLSGRERVLLRTPAPSCVLDVAADGSVLIEQHMPTEQISAMAPGESREKDLSWLDFSYACDLSSDGTTLLFDESGAGVGDTYRLFLRRTDGSPPIRLSEGCCGSLSPDGRWALSLLNKPSPHFVLVPTRSGDSAPILLGSVIPRKAWFFPDGKRLLVLGEEPGHGLRFYAKDLAGDAPRPITPEGIRVSAFRPISPDGGRVLARGPEGALEIYPAAGGEAQIVPGANPGDSPVQWSSDGRGVYVMERKGLLHSVFRIDVDTGRRTLWKEITPSDPAGFMGIGPLLIAADEKSYAYSHSRTLAELYLVTGLK